MDVLSRFGDDSLRKELLDTVKDMVNSPATYKLSPEDAKPVPQIPNQSLSAIVAENFLRQLGPQGYLDKMLSSDDAGKISLSGGKVDETVNWLKSLVGLKERSGITPPATATASTDQATPVVDPAERRSRHIADLVTTGMSYPEAETQATKEGYASGFTVQNPGKFTGNLHGKEELLNQAQVSKGPGPISKVLADLYDFKGQSNPSQQYAPAPITVNFYNSISRDVDVDSFLFKARGELERLTTRNGGYRRGGAVGR
jgi:hypothetical protein